MNPKLTPRIWQQVTDILPEVRRLPPGERGEFLRRRCGDDRILIGELESLLEHEHDDVRILDGPILPWRFEPRCVETSRIGQPIGHFKILEKIGDGGMGTVYRASREEGYAQVVALKVIRYADKELERRFHRERQILAGLEHPNIARILHGGTTPDGLPYFAMELIDGKPIDRFCDSRRLRIRERLELFRKVCGALHFSHQNLVVHRDLKPGNILVTDDGEPKIVDFGIAKQMTLEAGPETAATRPGLTPMTTGYASPEQLYNHKITTASDVYSLGVLLYRLLTGHHPYRLDGRSYVETAKAICEDEPTKPSTAVGRSDVVSTTDGEAEVTPESVGRDRRSEPRKLRRDLAGDLDSIVLKALRKEPENRYGSVQQMADDIERHLHGLPVLARDGTFLYVAGRLVRRHKPALAAIASFLMFTVLTTVLWQRAERESEKAGKTRDALKQLIRFYDPDVISPGSSLRDSLREFQEELTEDLRGEPEILADILGGPLVSTYRSRGFYEEAKAALDETFTLLRTLYTGDHLQLAKALHNQGDLLHRMGYALEAEGRFRESLGMKQRLGLEDAAMVRTLNNLAAVLTFRGSYEEAEEIYRHVLELRKKLYGEGHPRVAMSLRHIGHLHYLRGDLDEAERLFREVLRIALAASTPQPRDVASFHISLGRVLQAKGELNEAEGNYARALTIRREILGEDHPDTARTKKDFAGLLIRQGELATAEVLLGQAQEILRPSRPDGDWVIADLEGLLGSALAAQGRFSEAEPCLLEDFRVTSTARGRDSIYTRIALERLVELYEAWKKPRELAEYRALLGKNGRPGGPPPEGSESAKSFYRPDASTTRR